MAQYVLVQPLVMLPASLLMIEGLGRAWKRRREEPLPAGLYLVLLGAPVLVFYLLVSVAAEVEGNWAMAAYVTLFPAAGWYVVRAYDERRGSGRFTAMASWRFALIGGLAAAVLMLRIDLVAGSGPVRWAEGALRSAGVLKEDQRMIPVGRVLGAEVVAASAAALGERVREETGREPFYIATIYGRASQLAYYLPGRPPVYCTGERTGGRKTQFDFWPDHDLDDPGLLGRPAVLVGGEKYQWEPAFAGVREAGMLRGETKKGRIAFVGIGYRGWGGRVVP